jgi:pimeloyl-ACP methyl ester carboxylesterase
MIAWLSWILVAAAAAAILAVAVLVAFTAWTAQQVEKHMPPAGRFIDVDGARIHYVDEGAGPVLLLIHGLSGQLHNFTHSLLAPLSQDFRVVILDRPGSGYSTRPAGTPAAVVAQARLISRFCEELGLDRPLVVGHSLGGAIALALAMNHPEHVGGLALVAPATQRPDRVPAPFDRMLIASPRLRRVIAWTVATPMSIRNSARTLEVLFGPEPVPPDFAVRGGGLLSLRPVSFYGASTDLVASHGDLDVVPPQYESLTMPVGVLFGTADRVLDPDVHGRAFAAQVAGAELELIEGGGHMIPVTAADRTVAFIARMARRVAAARERSRAAAQGVS